MVYRNGDDDDNPSFVNGQMNYFSGNGGLLTRYKIADMHRAGIVSAVASNALPHGTHHDASQSDPVEPTAKTSMWEGMDTDRIPVFVDDQSIPTHDRFPHHPFGPVVPGPTYIDSETGRIDTDKLFSHVADRMEVGMGNYDVLADHQQASPVGDGGSVVLAAGRMYDSEAWRGRSSKDVRRPGTAEDARMRGEYERFLEEKRREFNSLPWYSVRKILNQDPLFEYTYDAWRKEHYPGR